MAAAMLTIPVVDGLAKYLSDGYSPLFISWARYAVACVFILPVAFLRFGRNVLPRHNLAAHFFRTLCLVVAMTLYFVSISLIPMATAISAFFIAPVCATAMAVVFLGERLTRWKIAALMCGVAGVFFIVQPQGGIQPGILLALLAGVAFAAYLVATRAASRQSDPVKTLVFQCLIGTLLLTPQMILTFQMPQLEVLHLFTLLGLLSVVSHLMSISAFRYAETSVLSPLVYLELVGALIIGYLVFNDTPGAAELVGAVLIIIGGVLLLRKTGR